MSLSPITLDAGFLPGAGRVADVRRQYGSGLHLLPSPCGSAGRLPVFFSFLLPYFGD